MKSIYVVMILIVVSACNEASGPDAMPSVAGKWRAVSMDYGQPLPYRWASEKETYAVWLHISVRMEGTTAVPSGTSIDSVKIYQYDENRRQWGPNFTWSVNERSYALGGRIAGDTIEFTLAGVPPGWGYGFGAPDRYVMVQADELVALDLRLNPVAVFRRMR